MILSEKTKVLIVGLGLLGGSYAMGLSEKGFHVEAITLNQEDIDYAVDKGWISGGDTRVIKERVQNADLIVFALYPKDFLAWIKEYQHFFRPGTLLTDVTGVKGGIVKEIQSVLRDDVEFIAAHPMAGREQSGVRHSDATVFRGANYIVVPTEKNTESAIRACEELGKTLGFTRISRLSAEEHDRMIAYLSQLTHCIAVSLMCCNNDLSIKNYSGDSFRDLTRIAKINDKMWSELFIWNRESLLEQMDLFLDAFRRMKKDIEEGNTDDLRAMMRTSTERRSQFDR